MQDLSFEHVLTTKKCSRWFYQYLSKNQNTEMFDFLNVVSNDKLTFHEIVEEYVKPGAKKELNLQQQMRAKILESWESNERMELALNELQMFIKLQLKESCFQNFLKQPEYKELLVEQYDKEQTMKALEGKDVSEWNHVEVFLYLYWNNMSYILDDPRMLGRIERPTGPRLFMLIEGLKEKKSDRILVSSHRKILTALLSDQCCDNVERLLTFSLSYKQQSTSFQIRHKSLMKNPDASLKRLQSTIARVLNLRDTNICLKIKDNDGDYVKVSRPTDLKYLIEQSKDDRFDAICHLC